MQQYCWLPDNARIQLLCGASWHHISLGHAAATQIDMQRRLYSAIHDVALPNFSEGSDITERFIMLIPGEVLNYYDYCPLSEAHGEHDDSDRLPPDENRFRLSDTVPNLNPLGGGLTGDSLSLIYENILYMIDTSSTVSDPFAQKSYSDSMKYLTTKITDPSDKNAPNISRYDLYYRYKTQYFTTRMQVKQWLDGNKTKLSFAEYETWYHENYETLIAYTSAAYTQWMVSGEKGPVEDKLSMVDIKSLREVVEEATSRRSAFLRWRIEVLPSAFHPIQLVSLSQGKVR